MKRIFDYKKALERQKINQGGRTQRLLKFIDDGDVNGAEYIIFGLISLPATDSDTDADIGEPPPLETEAEVAKRQQAGQGLKIMTPKQMILRLPILLAEKKAGNNSQKLKNEIRQITYSLYRSNNLIKTVYNNLISTI